MSPAPHDKKEEPRWARMRRDAHALDRAAKAMRMFADAERDGREMSGHDRDAIRAVNFRVLQIIINGWAI